MFQPATYTVRVSTPRTGSAVNTLGEEIRRLREHSNLSQSELARSLNKGASTICNIEGGRRGVPPGWLSKLADRLGVSVGYLMPFVERFVNGAGRAQRRGKKPATVKRKQGEE